MLFLEDSYSERLDTWRPDFLRHEKPTSVDVVSIQESLRKIYDDRAPEGVNATNQNDPLNRSSQKSCASTLREYSPLASHINKQVRFDGVLQDLFSFSPGIPMQQPKDSTEGNPKSKLDQLISLSRENLEASLTSRERDQSDVSMWYSLLEISVLDCKTRNLESETEDSKQAIKACTDPFFKPCEHGTFDVTGGPSPNFYKISIGNSWYCRLDCRQSVGRLPGAEQAAFLSSTWG